MDKLKPQENPNGPHVCQIVGCKNEAPLCWAYCDEHYMLLYGNNTRPPQPPAEPQSILTIGQDAAYTRIVDSQQATPPAEPECRKAIEEFLARVDANGNLNVTVNSNSYEKFKRALVEKLK